MLPPPCRWIDYDAYSCLMWHYGCVAVVYLDGRVVIQWGAGLEAKAASLEQGKRHVERWVSARPGLPPGKRAMAMRARMRGEGRRGRQWACAVCAVRYPNRPI